jgi:cullin 1
VSRFVCAVPLRTLIAHAATGANILGQEVYERLKEYLSKHVDDLYQARGRPPGGERVGARRACTQSDRCAASVWGGPQDAAGHMDDTLVQDYMRKWEVFKRSIPVINFIFRYLNRNWIPRAMDECKPYVFPVDVVRSQRVCACVCARACDERG